MKILVTGGAGFIGSQIVDAYINANHEVLVIDNLSTGQIENLNPKAKFFEMDITSPEARVVINQEKPEIINHHAAQIDVRKSVDDPQFDLKVNVGGTINLLSACKDIGLKKVIFSSTGGAIYGEQTAIPATENHQLNPLSPYGINKMTSEKYLAYFSGLFGFKLICFRYANVYGPRQNAHGEAGVVAIFINKIISGEETVINGTGLQTRDYVFVKDVVTLNLKALEPDLQGTFNVGTSIQTNVNQIFDILASLLEYKKSAKHGVAKLGEQMISCLSSNLIKQACGYAPNTKLSDGLKETVSWFMEQHQI